MCLALSAELHVFVGSHPNVVSIHVCNVWVCWVLGAFIMQSRCVYVFGVCGIAVYALADYGIAPSMQVTFDLAGTALPADQLAR